MCLFVGKKEAVKDIAQIPEADRASAMMVFIMALKMPKHLLHQER